MHSFYQVKFKTKLEDRPGELLKVLKVIAEHKGNIVSIVHNWQPLEISYKQAEIIIELETRNQDHINQIVEQLKKEKSYHYDKKFEGQNSKFEAPLSPHLAPIEGSLRGKQVPCPERVLA